MTIGSGKRQYVLLAILMTCTLYAVYEVLTFTHELGHGLVAISLGGYFPFVGVDADGGRSLFYFPMGSPSWKEAVVLLAGPVFNVLTAVVALGIVAVGVKSRQWRSFWALVGGVASLMVINVTGLFPPWWRNYKETGEALEMLGFPFAVEVAVKCVWLALGILLVISFFRLYFKEVSADFPTRTYRQRLAIVTSVLVVPCVLIMGALSIVMLKSGFGEGVLNPKRHWPHMILLAATFLLMPLLIAQVKADKPVTASISWGRLSVWGCLAVSIAISQAVFFGNDRSAPRGLFLMKRPPEVNVEACNVRVTLESGNRARVQLLMRPFGANHTFLWAKANGHEPVDWTPYELFAKRNLRVLLGTDNYEIVGRYSDDSGRFFTGSWSVGARVIEAEAQLSSLVKDDPQAGARVLTLVDFWRVRGAGYIDCVEIDVQNGLAIKSVREDPEGATPPMLHTDRQLQWINTSIARTFSTTYVTLE